MLMLHCYGRVNCVGSGNHVVQFWRGNSIGGPLDCRKGMEKMPQKCGRGVGGRIGFSAGADRIIREFISRFCMGQ